MSEGRTHTLREILEGSEIIESRGDLDVEVRSVHHDSRLIEESDVFFALDGAHVRGLDFAEQALARGASAIVSEELAQVGSTAVAVRNIRRSMALAACAACDHPTRQVKTVGITGTNGKTTTTYLLEAAATAAGWPSGVIGTINARVGQDQEVVGLTTPEAPALQRLARKMVDAGAQALFIEVTSHGIKLNRVHGSGFGVVAFSNLTQDHLDLHGSMDDYAATKLKLFNEELAYSKDAVAVINIDDATGQKFAQSAACPVLTVSALGADGADIRVVDRKLSPRGIEAQVDIQGQVVSFRSPLIGEHNLANISLAIGIIHALGMPLEKAVQGLGALEKVPGRAEPVLDPRGNVVLIDYAHTPDALHKVAEGVSRFTQGRLIVVFGCGGDRDQSKRPKMGAAAASHGDIVIVTSDNPRTEDPMDIIDMALDGVRNSGLSEYKLSELRDVEKGFAVEPDRRTAIGAAIKSARSDDVVLIAGKGHEPYQILGETKIHFDDREEAEAAIRKVMAQSGQRQARP